MAWLAGDALCFTAIAVGRMAGAIDVGIQLVLRSLVKLRNHALPAASGNLALRR